MQRLRYNTLHTEHIGRIEVLKLANYGLIILESQHLSRLLLHDY